MSYYVTTWSGESYFVTTKPDGERFAATFNHLTRVGDTSESAITRLAAHCGWGIKNVMAASPVQCFKERVIERVEKLRINGVVAFDEIIAAIQGTD